MSTNIRMWIAATAALAGCGASDAPAQMTDAANVDAPPVCDDTGVAGCACAPVGPGQGGQFSTPHAVIELVADPARCRVYGLTSTGVIVFDVREKREMTAVPIAAGALDLAIARDGSRLVAAHGAARMITLIDPESLATRTFTTTSDVERVEVDRRRAFYVTKDQWSEGHRVELDTGVDTMLHRQVGYQPDIELSGDGRLLYVATSSSSSGSITVYGVAEDAFGIVDFSGRSGTGLPVTNYQRHVYLAPDGARLYYAGLQVDGADVSTSLGALDDRILAAAPSAQLAVGVTQNWDTDTRQPLGGIGATAAAFVADEQELWTYTGSGQITYTATADLR